MVGRMLGAIRGMPATPLPLPSLDALPLSPLAHPVLHAIVGGTVRGKTQKALAAKHGLELAYVRGVIRRYLREGPG
jgi:hypothetical protein